MTPEQPDNIRERFRKTGLSGMSDEEVLELILSYTKKGDEPKRIAKSLINNYIDLLGVLSVRPKRLIAYDGLDEQSAVLLSLFKVIAKSVFLEKNTKTRYLRKTEDIKEYVDNCLKLNNVESFLVICLDSRYRVLNSEIISEGTGGETLVNERVLLERLLTYRSAKAIIAHNHPKGSAKPSQPDIFTTRSIAEFLKSIEIELLDHIIVGNDGIISLRYETDCFKPLED